MYMYNRVFMLMFCRFCVFMVMYTRLFCSLNMINVGFEIEIKRYDCLSILFKSGSGFFVW